MTYPRTTALSEGSDRVLNLSKIAIATAVLAMAVLAMPLLALPVSAKDSGPLNPICDGHGKASAEWVRCTEARPATDSELFYAGYWLAKSGAYHEALERLQRVANPDARVLTYIGFALRKLGKIDAALGHYSRALAADPDFTVARAYLGEAYLTLGDPARANVELAEIRARCGTGCAEYADLAGHIQNYGVRSKL